MRIGGFVAVDDGGAGIQLRSVTLLEGSHCSGERLMAKAAESYTAYSGPSGGFLCCLGCGKIRGGAGAVL